MLETTAAIERIDTLLALALLWDRHEASASDQQPQRNFIAENAGDRSGAMGELFIAPAPLSALEPATHELVARRVAWFQQLQPQERERWLLHTLRRARTKAQVALLDEHVHPTHIVEALRHESRRTQALVLQHLPSKLAQLSAVDLQIELTRTERRRKGDRRRHSTAGALPSTGHERRKLSDRRRSRDRRQTLRYADTATLPPVDVKTGGETDSLIAVVRRSFLASFVAFDALDGPSALDRLSGAQLARLVHLLGIRETAIACRGIMKIEAITSFLRRFPAEDAPALAAHMGALKEIAPARVAFAEELVSAAMKQEFDQHAMLNRVGLSLLAVAMSSAHDSLRLRYTIQKLPLSVARVLRSMSADWRRRIADNGSADRRAFDTVHLSRELTEQVTDEVETLASELCHNTVKSNVPPQHTKKRNLEFQDE